jgi:hypothetical protein
VVTRATPAIGTLNESPLHASLKTAYAQPGDLLEATVDGYVVDILRGDLIIEVQTAQFGKIARKLRDLVSRHPVRLVYPVPRDSWIVKLPQHGGEPSRRKSPKRGRVINVFDELVSVPDLLTNVNFALDVVLTQEEELRAFDSKRRWRRRGWTTVERRLLDIVETRTLSRPDDYLALLPDLPNEFLTSDIAAGLGCRRDVAQRAAYCLRKAGLLEAVDRRGNAIVYRRVSFR